MTPSGFGVVIPLFGDFPTPCHELFAEIAVNSFGQKTWIYSSLTNAIDVDIVDPGPGIPWYICVESTAITDEHGVAISFLADDVEFSEQWIVSGGKQAAGTLQPGDVTQPADAVLPTTHVDTIQLPPAANPIGTGAFRRDYYYGSAEFFGRRQAVGISATTTVNEVDLDHGWAADPHGHWHFTVEVFQVFTAGGGGPAPEPCPLRGDPRPH
jgi:hypothetical protein